MVYHIVALEKQCTCTTCRTNREALLALFASKSAYRTDEIELRAICLTVQAIGRLLDAAKELHRSHRPEYYLEGAPGHGITDMRDIRSEGSQQMEADSREGSVAGEEEVST